VKVELGEIELQAFSIPTFIQRDNNLIFLPFRSGINQRLSLPLHIHPLRRLPYPLHPSFISSAIHLSPRLGVAWIFPLRFARACPSPSLLSCMQSLTEYYTRDDGWQTEGEVDRSLSYDVSRVRCELRAVFPFRPSGCQGQGEGAREIKVTKFGATEPTSGC
jgi:hypothetical protein